MVGLACVSWNALGLGWVVADMFDLTSLQAKEVKIIISNLISIKYILKKRGRGS